MADPIRVSGAVSGTDKTLTFETGKLAQQSQGAVVASIGGTTVLTTANAARDVRPGTDFFPLTVDVEERAYAAGKIPGSFFRREGRPTEDAVLTCRLTDRPLRPSFPKDFRNETQVVTTVIGADQENPHDVLSINAASAALMISGIPFEGPIGSVRIAYSTDGEWIPYPTYAEAEASVFELVVAGRQLDSGDVAIMMVEAGGTEKSFSYYAEGARKVDEEVLADGLEACKVWIKESIALQRQLVASVIATRGPIVPLDVHTAGRLRHRRVRCGREAGHDEARHGHHDLGQGRSQRRRRRGRDRGPGRALRHLRRARRVRRSREGSQRGRPLAHQEAGPPPDRRRGCPHRRAWPDRPASGVGRGRRAADGTRLRSVPARRDAGDDRRHARHAAHEPAARHALAGDDEALHAPLQHAAVGQRRDRPRRLTQAPRDRSRCARRPGRTADGAEPGGVRLHAAPRQ